MTVENEELFVTVPLRIVKNLVYHGERCAEDLQAEVLVRIKEHWNGDMRRFKRDTSEAREMLNKTIKELRDSMKI